MIDEDLMALHGMLRRMPPSEKIIIGNRFICSARELDWVIEEALSARERAKMEGFYEAYRPVLAE